jgi:hypothetical protein
VSGAEALLVKLILVLASVCLVVIAVGLAGAVVWVSGLDAPWERDDGWGR